METTTEEQRLWGILDRVNQHQREVWYDPDRRAETLMDAVEMILSRVERLERTSGCNCPCQGSA